MKNNTSETDWHFYRYGVFQPVPEQEVRDVADKLSYYSDQRGGAAVLMKQMWNEIDRLRAKIKDLEDAK